MTCTNIMKGYQLTDNKTHANKYRHITNSNKFSKLPILPYQTTGQTIQVIPAFVYLSSFMVMVPFF